MGARVRLPLVPLGDLLTPLLAAGLACWLFARGLRRARARRFPRDAGWDRAALFGLGLLAGLSGLLVFHGPAEERASAHMLQHVLVGDAMPALLLVALRGSLAVHVVPRTVRRVLASRSVRALLRPWPSLAAWGALLWVWHVPAVYDAALASEWVHPLQHASFVLGGLLLWNQLVDPLRRGLLGLWGSLRYALAAMVVGQMLVALLVLSYRPLYAYGSTADQGLAGLIMALAQLSTLGTYALVRLRAHFREPLPLGRGHPLGV
ncbi:MAG TPA: cytochrome c oxidase assembly protein [Gaiellaceae bacterium]|nr:cytochrome c oxidase assembly protein [Gaiellaceae bacterium]